MINGDLIIATDEELVDMLLKLDVDYAYTGTLHDKREIVKAGNLQRIDVERALNIVKLVGHPLIDNVSIALKIEALKRGDAEPYLTPEGYLCTLPTDKIMEDIARAYA